jgi:lactate dehydrogenase-like 2-hydroxyacid dehydrogenase
MDRRAATRDARRTQQSTGPINGETLARLPDNASLINFARGPIVDDAALKAALDSAKLGRAALDVFVAENILRFRESGAIPVCVDRAQGYQCAGLLARASHRHGRQA